ncbi:hypothetical protein EKO04_011157 [Ascochyta lentis]|uniref:Uncharacterized protein n=1 Tax=Ascochyta lentis TaxID=205686 RepID=A0A8H7IUI3_9PLEO|nr:hypothetical protein EKO04_011157 [Ascochyta lentis]
MTPRKKNHKSTTDTEALHVTALHTNGPSRKRRRTSNTREKNGKKESDKLNKSVRPKKPRHKTHQEINAGSTKPSNFSAESESDGDVRMEEDADISDIEGDGIEGGRTYGVKATQIRTVFQGLLAVLDDKHGANEQHSSGHDDHTDRLHRQAPDSSKVAAEQFNTGARPDPSPRKMHDNLTAETSTQTTAADNTQTPNSRQQQNTRVATIVQWAQNTRTYNPTATLIHPFNLAPPTKTHPLPPSLSQQKFRRPDIEQPPSPHLPARTPTALSSSDHGNPEDITALYEQHPAYAHLTPEQRIQAQRLVEEEGAKTVLDRRVEVVEAELSLGRAQMWGDEEAIREKREVLECLAEEVEFLLVGEGRRGGVVGGGGD